MDYQKPHSEDEVYYVASGRAKMMINSDGDSSTFDVGPGTIIFVPALVHHFFYDITERLALLVFTAPSVLLSALALKKSPSQSDRFASEPAGERFFLGSVSANRDRTPPYFCCIASTVLVTASSLTSPKSISESTSWKIGPQTGISLLPWAGGPDSFPSMISFTRRKGNVPPFLCEIRVKSGAPCFSATDAGP